MKRVAAKFCCWGALFVAIYMALPHTTAALPETIKVGGLFETTNSELEMAFRYAIHRINTDRHVLQNTRLSAQVERIQVHDSFHASKSVCKLVEEEIAAIVGPRETSVSPLVRSTCQALHLPHIEVNWDYRYKPTNFTLNMYPDVTVLSLAFMDYVLERGWKSVTIVYEDNEGLIRVRDILSTPAARKIKITVRQFGGTKVKDRSVKVTDEQKKKSYKKFFKDISKTGETNIVLDFPIHKIPQILQEAQEVGMMTVYHNYLITSLDMHTVDLSPFQKLGTNITGFTLVDPSSQEALGEFNDWLFGEVHSERSQISKKRPLKTENALLYDGLTLFARALHDLERTEMLEITQLSCEPKLSWLFGERVVQYMKMVNMKGLTGPIKFDEDGVRRKFLLEVVDLKPMGLVKVGTWSLKDDPDEKRLNISRNTTSDEQDALESLRRKKIIMTTIKNSPYTMLKENADKLEGNDRFEGYCVDLVYEIAKWLNFTYEIRLVKDGNYGAKNKDTGEWNGMIRELIDREADIVIADVSITFDREEAVDFTMPFMNLGISILFKKPLKQEPQLFSFLSPFSLEVWMYMATALLGVSLLLYFLARISPDEWENPHPCDTEPEFLENQFNLQNSFWFTIGSLMQQGSDILPKAISTRTLASLWWFFVLIMISSYTANLAAFLTAQRMTSPIESATDLAKQTTIHYGCVASGSTKAFFEKSDIDPYNRMWSFMESTRPSVFVENNQKGIERVMKGDYAFFMESTTIEYVVERNCDVQQVGGLLDNKGYGIATPTGSPYRNILSRAVIELQEAGILHLLKERWWKEKGGGNCPDDGKADSADLGLASVGGVFVVLLAGMAVGCVIAVVEFMWKTMQISKANRDTVCKEMIKELKEILTCRGSQRPLPPEETSSTATGIDSMPKTPSRGSVGTSRKESTIRWN